MLTPLSGWAYSNDIETITVTSQRVERSIIDLASNSTFIDQETISLLNLKTIEDVIALTPNVTMKTLSGDFDYIQMRGMPRNIEHATVSVYIDGVPYSNLYGLNLSLLNVQSVEVIRGPQANMFGRNTRDGVIVITTNKGFDSSDSVGAQLSSRSGKQFSFSATTPLLDDNLALSLQGEWKQQDGMVKNNYLGGQIDDTKYHQWHFNAHWPPSEQLTVNVSVDRLKKNNGAYSYVDGNADVNRGDPLATSLDTQNQFDLLTQTVALAIDWQFTPHWQFSSISSASTTDVFGRFDADFSQSPYGHYDTWLADKDLYQEFRLSTPESQRTVSWLFGASYSKNTDDNRNDYALMALNSHATLVKKGSVIYGDMTWQINEDWQLQSGVRWLRESFDASTQFSNPFIPTPTVSTQGDKSLSDHQLLGKLSLSVALAPHQQLYVNAGQGYLSGGVTWMAEDIDLTFSRQGTGLSYSPEKSTTLEIGYKGLFPAIDTRLDLSVYRSSLANYQHNYQDLYGLSHIVNVAQVQSHGAEFSLTTALNENLDWVISAGVNNSKIKEVDNSLGLDAQIGAYIPNAAKNNIHSRLSYQTTVSSQWSVRSALSYNRYGTTYFDFAQRTEQPSYDTVGVSLSAQHSSQWKIALWAKNITDTRYKQFQVLSGGLNIATYGNVREFGIGLSRSF